MTFISCQTQTRGNALATRDFSHIQVDFFFLGPFLSSCLFENICIRTESHYLQRLGQESLAIDTRPSNSVFFTFLGGLEKRVSTFVNDEDANY